MNLIFIIYAFIGGVVTILSPCILPLLPIILSGGTTGGKKRPLGIIFGFILSFTFFTLFLSAIIKLTGIPSDAMRLISVCVLFAFGISLLIPKFQQIIEASFSKLTGKINSNNVQSGFLGGLIVGLSLGLIWIPCVGPILA